MGGKQASAQHLELKGQEIQQQQECISSSMADSEVEEISKRKNSEEIKRKNSTETNSSTLKSVKSASINVIKKGTVFENCFKMVSFYLTLGNFRA